MTSTSQRGGRSKKPCGKPSKRTTRTTLGWLTDTIFYDGPVDEEAAGFHWGEEHVYPHFRVF